ncbi:hypothetical protein [Vulcaniibacterium gelatinicum]|nr:hypothetical protein [Vulcaniibacterium gelatinicum]
MRESLPPLTEAQAAARRKAVRRTAWLVALAALAIYALFLWRGVSGA